MRWRHVSLPFSALMSLVIVALFFTHGLNFGIDFKGGTLMEIHAKSGTADVAGVREQGPVKYWLSLVPHMDVPIVLKPFLWVLMFVIEIAGLLIRHVVLAVRLFANMMAGHIVLAVILGFIAQAAGIFVYLVTPASIAGVVALSLLELFVAFLQAYIFTFLSALFIGTAVHPH